MFSVTTISFCDEEYNTNNTDKNTPNILEISAVTSTSTDSTPDYFFI